MPDTLLNILKFFLIALIWLFFLRVTRAIWVEVREPASGSGGPLSPGQASPASASYPSATEAPRMAPSVTGRNIPTLHLTVIAPPEHADSLYELMGNESVIGRAAGCAVSIADDTFVSHLHARIFMRGSQFWVEDLGSTNGSFVNSRKLTAPVPLRHGDRIQIGRTILQVEK